jgi:hypothetical protein
VWPRTSSRPHPARTSGSCPTKSIPQGLAALTAYLVDRPLDANADAMREGGDEAVRSVEVTSADKDATIDGVSVRRGQVIGIVDDVLVVAGDDLIAVAVADAGACRLGDGRGGDGPGRQGRRGGAGAALQGRSESSTEHRRRGARRRQPHYDFLIAVE